MPKRLIVCLVLQASHIVETELPATLDNPAGSQARGFSVLKLTVGSLQCLLLERHVVCFDHDLYTYNII